MTVCGMKGIFGMTSSQSRATTCSGRFGAQSCLSLASLKQAALTIFIAALQQIQERKESIRKTYLAGQHTRDKDPRVIEQLFDTFTEVPLRYNVLETFHRGVVRSEIPVIRLKSALRFLEEKSSLMISHSQVPSTAQGLVLPWICTSDPIIGFGRQRTFRVALQKLQASEQILSAHAAPSTIRCWAFGVSFARLGQELSCMTCPSGNPKDTASPKASKLIWKGTK